MIRRISLAAYLIFSALAVSSAEDLSTSSGEEVTINADRIDVNQQTKTATAHGHVEVLQASGTLTGSEAEYHWEASTGVLKNAVGHSPPWSFSSDELHQSGPGRFTLHDGEFTSCTESPPHFHLDTSRAKVRLGKRANMTNVRLVADETPIFWLPFYSRSLIPKKYRLRVEPGQSSRDGFTAKTIFSYPFTPNTRTRLRWDYLERTGNGGGVDHEYFLPNMRGSFDSYYVRDTNPDTLPQSKRYSMLWNHYQKIASPLTLNAKVDFKSDQTFGNQFQNVGNNIRVENQVRGLLSEAGLNYQFSKASLQAQFDRRDKFDSTVSSSNFISKLTLPRLTFNTIPLTSKIFPFYTSFTGSWVNETLDRTTPQNSLRYQRSGAFGTQIRKDIKVNRNMTVTPLLGYDQAWQDRDLGQAGSEKDIYVGRSSLGGNVRQRIRRSTNLNMNYRYTTRNRRNQTKVDSSANDFGIETNQFSTSWETWLGYSNRITLASGYDFRDAPRNFTSKYDHLSERITPPSLDLHWEPRKNLAFNFRETYGLYNPQIQNSVRTPINTSGEIQVGQLTRNTYFTQGFSYTKQFGGTKSQVIFTNKLKFYLSPKWYVDAFLSYRAEGPGGMNFKKVFPIERTIQVVRDMHCWVLRMDFSNRPGITEASFYIDLKTNFTGEKNLFAGQDELAFYPTRLKPVDPTEIFPVAKP